MLLTLNILTCNILTTKFLTLKGYFAHLEYPHLTMPGEKGWIISFIATTSGSVSKSLVVMIS